MVHGPLGMPRLACQQSGDPQLDNCRAALVTHSKLNQHDRSTYEQTITIADRATRPLGREFSRQGAPKGPLYPRLPSLSEGPDDEMSGISFDLNELLYARLDSLDSRWTENLTDDEDNTLQLPLPPLRSPKGKEREKEEEIRRLREEFAKERKDMEQNIERTRRLQFINRYAIRQSYKSQNHFSGFQTSFSKAILSFLKSLDRVATKIVLRSSSDQTTLEATRAIRQKRTRQNLRAFRTKSALAKDSVQISVPNLSNPRREFSNSRRGSSTLGRTDKLLRSLNRPRIDKRDTKGMRIAKNAPKALAILTMTDERKTEEIGREIEVTDTEKDLGFGNEPLKDLRRGRTTGNYIGNPLPIRLLARHNTLAYGTLSALDDDNDDFFELRATDLHLRAKELALFARSFLKELKKENPGTSFSECFEKLVKELKGIQGFLRPGLRDDRSLADKLYSACKNVLETTIARMNLAFTSTAAVADIRKAIAFATKTSRPPAKASFMTTYGTFDADEVYKQLEIQTAFYALTSQRYPEVQLDTSRAKEKSVKYGIGSATFIGAVTLDTLLSQVEFYVVESDVPFLLLLADIDKHKVILDNLRNVLVQRKKEILVYRGRDRLLLLYGRTIEDYLQAFWPPFSSTLRQMLVEAYHSVGLVERYYVLVRRAFEIVIKELPKALREDRLQMAIKAINDTAGLNGLKYDLSISTVLDEEEGDSYVLFTKDFKVLITDKERRDYELLAKLRAEGIIKSPGASFQDTDLRAKGAKIFGSKFVDEIKGKGTLTLYEKSRILRIAALQTDDVLMIVNLVIKIGFVAIFGNEVYLGILNFLVVVCIDSYSLYECIVKLGTIKEKRLMIDIIAIRESYERRELFKHLKAFANDLNRLLRLRKAEFEDVRKAYNDNIKEYNFVIIN
ncbi:polyprotein [Drepanopeziza brunnea f. sp. 'multigermtubi' MB_m1]|uniref:Polyprotein n=1 Tax=Marssonina brunnea f. sp. multigermtubi (strain MB_m1) TaxID=1072389 RepID=K1XJM1_MARBU|nr:polyprotein [Drepanopeziza brunnea f. sp. 'multigermtubi' MB_m1]EKD20888.1 polyprotein [Drepanopeziza brunnea f. sp. 'multigermtubi' MB_m1]